MALDHTIYALASGSLPAGVAVIRISGACAGTVVQALTGVSPEPRKATLLDIRDPADARLLDRGLVLWFPAPASYTGEDTAELQVHGGRAVVAAILEALSRLPGLRMAQAGEFTRRAFVNGRLDLTEVEGLGDLIAAETEAQRRQALAQAGGVLRELYDGWRSRIIQARALIEAGLDFSDEGDVADEVAQQARPFVEGLARAIAAHLDDGRRGEILRDGFQVVLAGPPNAGKSSLLNALARREVAIVSSEAGTTRDLIEVRLDLGGVPVTLTDTAGLRQSGGDIEREGMRRAVARAQTADLVLWLVDPVDATPEPPPELPRERVVVLHTKADIAPPVSNALQVSAKTGDGLTGLIAMLTERAGSCAVAGDAPVLTRERHRVQLSRTLEALQAYLDGAQDDAELRAEDLRMAADALGQITGRIDVEDLLGEIFSSFCIGK